MKENTPEELPFDDAAFFAVNAIAELCLKLQQQNKVPGPLILYALDVNHAMCAKIIVDRSFAALNAEQSESQKGG